MQNFGVLAFWRVGVFILPMALIKSTNARQLTRDAIALDLGDMQRRANQIIDDATRQAEEILRQAKATADQLISDAAAKGREQGLARGLDEGRAAGQEEGGAQVIEELKPQLEAISSAWTDAIKRWEADRGRMLLDARDDVLALALSMGRRVVHRIAAMDPSVVQDQLAAALKLVTRPTTATVRVHPDDYPLVEHALPEIRAAMESAGEISLVADAEIPRGGCKVATAGGLIDATIETQLDRIVEALMPHAESRAAADSQEQDAS